VHEDHCQHLLGDLSEYLDGEGTQEICAEIERHLQECDNCRVVFDTLRKTVLLYRDLPRPQMSTAARQRLYHALDLDAYLPGG
jgi:predicted anti-sigma-YlaC factor YlaD